MSLTKDDREIIELIAMKVAEKFGEAQTEAMRLAVQYHQDTCPHGKKLLESKWLVAGAIAVFILLTAGGSALGEIVMKALLSGG